MIRARLIQQYSKHITKYSLKSQLCFPSLVVAEFKPSCRAFSILVKMSSEKMVDKTPEKGKSFPRQLLDEIRGNKVTRSYTKEAEKNWREYYLNLPLDEKRKVYSCGKKYVGVDCIESWSTYGARVRGAAKPKFEIDEELNKKISLWRGDITALEIDVICNAANNSLLGGGGVDGAIHRAAGKKLLDECSRIGHCDTGDAKLTGGYKLPTKFILHTVGPIGENPGALKSCYRTCLNLMKENKLQTIAFPCISTGIYGYDVEKATPVVMETVREWLLKDNNIENVERIIFCVFLIKDVEVYEKNLLQFFPVDRPKELLEEKKPKGEETKSKSKQKVKEQKENRSEKKAENDMTKLKLEPEANDGESELPEKKKPKTVDDTESNTVSELPEKKKPKTVDDTESIPVSELPEKKKPKTVDDTESNPVSELPEKKKPKTVDDTESNPVSELPEKKKPKTSDDTESNPVSELPEKKKPKTVEGAESSPKKGKGKKDNETNTKSPTKSRKAKSEKEKKDDEQTKSTFYC